jgi:hypothetical protein
MFEYELKTSAGIVTWTGKTGVEACANYAECHPGVAVYAWRWPKFELRIGMIQIAD